MTDATLGTIKLTASDELESPARRALRRLFKRKGAVAGLVVIAIFVLLAVFAPLISPYEPIAIMALPRLGPRNAASAIARIRNGQASIASVMRLISASMNPPR